VVIAASRSASTRMTASAMSGRSWTIASRGFVLTGADLLGDGPPAGWPLDRPPMLFETGMPGVFAVGDVRHGSINRFASAVGEGSVAIRLVHEYLSHR
jgi:thioredoxin reductase (NADPH)